MRRFTVGYTIHNKKELIPQIMEGLKKGFTAEDEFIFVFDNCTDGSFELWEELVSLLPGSNFHYRCFKDDLFEIKANNVILKEASNDYIILFQDDIICDDSKIREKISHVYDLLGERAGLLGGRSGYELKSLKFPEQTVDKVSNWEHRDSQNGIPVGPWGNKVRTFLNRGPLVFSKGLIDKVGYLDEEYFPQVFDDMDYCARAKFEHGLTNAVFECRVKSEEPWGTTRNRNTNLYKLTRAKHFKKNWNRFISKWGKYIKP